MEKTIVVAKSLKDRVKIEKSIPDYSEEQYKIIDRTTAIKEELIDNEFDFNGSDYITLNKINGKKKRTKVFGFSMSIPGNGTGKVPVLSILDTLLNQMMDEIPEDVLRKNIMDVQIDLKKGIFNIEILDYEFLESISNITESDSIEVENAITTVLLNRHLSEHYNFSMTPYIASSVLKLCTLNDLTNQFDKGQEIVTEIEIEVAGIFDENGIKLPKTNSKHPTLCKEDIISAVVSTITSHYMK